MPALAHARLAAQLPADGTKQQVYAPHEVRVRHGQRSFYPQGADIRRTLRLGIGSAVHAYLLPYDKLPESPEALVPAGIVDTRYLQDTNRLPLKSRHEGYRLPGRKRGPALAFTT